jgi:hypothetical protein
MPTTLSAEQREELVAAIILLWPGNSAPERAKQAAALYLLRCPHLGANSNAVAAVVIRKLGATTSQCGVGPFIRLFQRDVCFRVGSPKEAEAWIDLRINRYALATSNRSVALE